MNSTLWIVVFAMILSSIVVGTKQLVDNQSRADYARGCYTGLEIAKSHSQENADACALKAGYGVRP